MPKMPERQLAAHVRAATAAGAQAKMGRQGNGLAGGQQMAAHVRAAIAAGAQAKMGAPVGERRMAAHVQAAIQPKKAGGVPNSRRVAAQAHSPAAGPAPHAKAATAQPPRPAGVKRVVPPPPRAPGTGVLQRAKSGALFDVKKNKREMESGFTPSKEQLESGRYWIDESPEGEVTWWYFDQGPTLTRAEDLIIGGYMRNPEDFWRDEQTALSLDPEWSYLDPYETGMVERPSSYDPSTSTDPLTRKGAVDEETVKDSTLWWYDKLRRAGVPSEPLSKIRGEIRENWSAGKDKSWWEGLRRRLIGFYHKNFWKP